MEKTSRKIKNELTVCPIQKNIYRNAITSKKWKKCENSEVLDSPNYHSMNEQEQLDLEEEEIEGDGEEEFLDFQVGGEIRTQFTEA